MSLLSYTGNPRRATSPLHGRARSVHDSPMQLTKRVLTQLKAPYPLGLLMQDGKQCVVGSTEDHGPIVMAAPPYRQAVEMVPGPGDAWRW